MFNIRVLIAAMAVAVCLVALQSQSVSAFSAPSGQAGDVYTFARHQIGKPFRIGTDGLRRYDCSGLVYRTYAETGLLDRIGGSRRLARGYYRWFKRHGLVSRSNPRPGDLVTWHKKGSPRVTHIGIYIGRNQNGKPMAISALINPWGVSKHRVGAIHLQFKAYLHVHLQL